MAKNSHHNYKKLLEGHYDIEHQVHLQHPDINEPVNHQAAKGYQAACSRKHNKDKNEQEDCNLPLLYP